MKIRRFILIPAAVLCIIFSGVFAYAAESQNEFDDDFFAKMIGLNLLEKNDVIDTDYMLRGDFIRLAMKVAGVDRFEQNGKDMYTDLELTGINKDYINSASQLGYISGAGGRFYPGEPIKFNEAIKIMTSILGYGNIAELEGGYPEGYLSCANRSGLLKGLKAEDYDALTLSEGLDIIDSALDARITEKYIKYNQVNVAMSNETLAQYLNIGEIEGIVSECGGTGLYSASMYSENMVCIGNVYMKVENPHDFDEYLGLNCKAYYRDDIDAGERYLGYFKVVNRKNNVLTISAEDAEFTGSGYTYYDNNKLKTARLSSLYSVIYNGQFANPQPELMSTENGFIKLIDNDGDSRYDVVFVYSFKTYILDDIEKINQKLIMKTGEIIEIEEDTDNYVSLFVDGEHADIEVLSPPVVVSYAESLRDNKRIKTVYVSSSTVSGDLKSISADELTIGDQQYKTYSFFAAGLSPNISGKFYIDSFDHVVYCEPEGKDYDYGYLMKCWRELDIDDSPCWVKVYNSSGVFETYQLADKCTYNGKKLSAGTVIENLFANAVKQFIRYRFNESGLISSIETASNIPVFTDEGEQARLNDTFRISSSGSSKYNTSNFSFNLQIVLGTTTKVFFIPSTGIEDHFMVTTRNFLVNDSTYTYTAYNADEYGTAEFVVCSLDYRGNTNNFYIVKGTSVMLDSNNEECNAVQCYSKGTLTTLLAADTSNFDKVSMKKGDVINVRTNAAGKVETFSVLWSNEKGSYPDFAYTTSMNSTNNIIGGEVIKYNRASGLLAVKLNGEYYIFTVSPSTAMVYESGDWYEIPSGDITVHDHVVFTTSRATITSITVIR